MKSTKQFSIAFFGTMLMVLLASTSLLLFFTEKVAEHAPEECFLITRMFQNKPFDVYENHLLNVDRYMQGTDFYISGTSRSQNALDEELFIDYWNGKRGGKAYHIGLTGEDMSFPYAMLESFDIRDATLLIFAELRYFRNDISSREMVHRNLFGFNDNILNQYATNLIELIKSYVKHVLWGERFVLESYISQSLRTGFWRFDHHYREDPRIVPKNFPAADPEIRYEELLGGALFFDRMKERNIAPILLCAPVSEASPEKIALLADIFGGRFIDISSEGLTLYDAHHLDKKSAAIFTERLIEKLDESSPTARPGWSALTHVQKLHRSLGSYSTKLHFSCFSKEAVPQQILAPSFTTLPSGRTLVRIPSLPLSIDEKFPVLDISIQNGNRSKERVSTSRNIKIDKQVFPGRSQILIPLNPTGPDMSLELDVPAHMEVQDISLRYLKPF